MKILSAVVELCGIGDSNYYLLPEPDWQSPTKSTPWSPQMDMQKKSMSYAEYEHLSKR